MNDDILFQAFFVAGIGLPAIALTILAVVAMVNLRALPILGTLTLISAGGGALMMLSHVAGMGWVKGLPVWLPFPFALLALILTPILLVRLGRKTLPGSGWTGFALALLLIALAAWVIFAVLFAGVLGALSGGQIR